MSYNNPNIPLITDPKGVDILIQDIQLALAGGLPWLEKSFGRAWLHQEVDTSGSVIKYPKCYAGGKEYINVLPNDNFKAMSFIALKQPEKYEKFSDMGMGNAKNRDASIIFWGNLKKINSGKDYIFTEELKRDIEKILVYLVTINAYYDEKAEQVFSDYSLNDVNTQYLMYPFFACRFDVTIKYYETLCSI